MTVNAHTRGKPLYHHARHDQPLEPTVRPTISTTRPSGPLTLANVSVPYRHIRLMGFLTDVPAVQAFLSRRQLELKVFFLEVALPSLVLLPSLLPSQCIYCFVPKLVMFAWDTQCETPRAMRHLFVGCSPQIPGGQTAGKCSISLI